MSPTCLESMSGFQWLLSLNLNSLLGPKHHDAWGPTDPSQPHLKPFILLLLPLLQPHWPPPLGASQASSHPRAFALAPPSMLHSPYVFIWLLLLIFNLAPNDFFSERPPWLTTFICSLLHLSPCFLFYGHYLILFRVSLFFPFTSWLLPCLTTV